MEVACDTWCTLLDAVMEKRKEPAPASTAVPLPEAALPPPQKKAQPKPPKPPRQPKWVPPPPTDFGLPHYLEKAGIPHAHILPRPADIKAEVTAGLFFAQKWFLKAVPALKKGAEWSWEIGMISAVNFRLAKPWKATFLAEEGEEPEKYQIDCFTLPYGEEGSTETSWVLLGGISITDLPSLKAKPTSKVAATLPQTDTEPETKWETEPETEQETKPGTQPAYKRARVTLELQELDPPKHGLTDAEKKVQDLQRQLEEQLALLKAAQEKMSTQARSQLATPMETEETPSASGTEQESKAGTEYGQPA
eukprot:jgi/Mesvir1/17415/Mv08699-RA.1